MIALKWPLSNGTLLAAAIVELVVNARSQSISIRVFLRYERLRPITVKHSANSAQRGDRYADDSDFAENWLLLLFGPFETAIKHG